MATAADEVGALRGVRAGTRAMVRQAIADMFLALLTVRGGKQAGAPFLEVGQLLAVDGLEVEDVTLYDDPTLRDAGRTGSNIPESMAAAGLRVAGRVHLAASLWRHCAPSGLKAIYRRDQTRYVTKNGTQPPGKLWMCKLDLSNAYWSISACPALGAARSSSRQGGSAGATPASRLAGSNLVICQRLVRGIVFRALEGMPVPWHVYLDDVLVSARSRSMAASVTRDSSSAQSRRWSHPRKSPSSASG